MTSLNNISRADAGGAARTTPASRYVGLLLLAVIFVAILWQLRWGTVPDTSWIITICERVYNGERLYTDIIEANPPFTVWLYMPAYLLSVWLRVAPELAVHAFTYAACLGGLGFAAYVAHRAGFAENVGLLPLLPVILALLLIFPGNAFTQRDHIGAALLAPLLVLTAWRIEAGASEQPSWRVAVAAGLAGSVIILVKPYYALLIAAPALYLAWRKRSLRPLFSPEYWVIGGVCAAYLGVVLWLYPEFLREIMPLLSETYLQIKRPFWMLLQKYAVGYLLLLIVLLWVRPGLPFSPLAAVFGLASLASVVVLAYQAKGWPYHAYPAIAFGLAAVLCQAVRPPQASLKELGGVRALLLAGAVIINAIPFMPTQRPGAELAAAIREASERPTVALIGSDIAAGHPLTRMVGGQWISAYCSDWLGAFSLYLGGIARLNGDPAAERYETIASDYAAFKLAELQRDVPEILLVQKEDTFWRDYLADYAGFSRFMSGYRLLSQDQTVQAYVRIKDEGSPAATSD